MAKINDNNIVGFRRVRGRVIPIYNGNQPREKKMGYGGQVAIGLGSAALSTASTVAAMKGRKGTSIAFAVGSALLGSAGSIRAVVKGADAKKGKRLSTFGKLYGAQVGSAFAGRFLGGVGLRAASLVHEINRNPGFVKRMRSLN